MVGLYQAPQTLFCEDISCFLVYASGDARVVAFVAVWKIDVDVPVAQFQGGQTGKVEDDGAEEGVEGDVEGVDGGAEGEGGEAGQVCDLGEDLEGGAVAQACFLLVVKVEAAVVADEFFGDGELQVEAGDGGRDGGDQQLEAVQDPAADAQRAQRVDGGEEERQAGGDRVGVLDLPVELEVLHVQAGAQQVRQVAVARAREHDGAGKRGARERRREHGEVAR
ncbi:hypothetical protein NEOLI_005358, partial [Neolecta irregularis DAH-3]